MASWEAHVGYYEGLSQNFVPDHQILLEYSVVRQILPYNHHLWALFYYKPSKKALFTCFLREFGYVLVRVWGGGLLGSMISQLLKKKLFTKFDVIFSKMLRLLIFFYRFLRKEQAHDTPDPWVTYRMASLPFNPKHLTMWLNDSGE